MTDYKIQKLKLLKDNRYSYSLIVDQGFKQLTTMSLKLREPLS